MNAYLIKRPIIQEYDTVLWVNSNIVLACPYNGPKHKEIQFRKQISMFFWHILHCSVYSVKFREETALPFIPFPYEFGKSELPMVFGANGEYNAKSKYSEKTENNFSRALDWLMENVFNVSPYSYGDHAKSRQFQIREEIFNGMYPVRPKSVQDILSRVRYCDPIFTKYNLLGKTIEQLCEKRSKDILSIPTHDLSAFDRNTQRKAVARYRNILRRLSPNTIALRPIIDEIAKFSHYKGKSARSRVILLHSNLMSFFANEFKLVEMERLIVQYYPVYRVTGVGGRLFEEHGGFQNLPRALKQKAHCVGHNVDMQSSQLNILKMELKRNKIPCRLLNETESISDFADLFGLPKEVAKICFYGMMFSIGGTMRKEAISHSRAMKALRISQRPMCRERARRELSKEGIPRSSDVDELMNKILDKECERIRVRWEHHTESIVVALEALCDRYMQSARKSGDGYVLTNAVGARYQWTGNDKEIRKRVLSHMITGIESDILFSTIEENNVKHVYSFEHDGALLSKCRLKCDRIKFVKKPFDSVVRQLVENL